MPSQMTFQEENGYIVCYIDGVEVSRAKKTSAGISPSEVVDIINTQIIPNPELSGTEPDLTGLQTGDNKYAVPAGGGSSLLEDIVDANGNKRFVEGEGTPEIISGFTSYFCKWSLSGTHLMFVLAGKFNTANITTNKNLTKYNNIPDYILDKIIPTFQTYYVEQKTISFFDDYGNSNSYKISLIKLTNGIGIRFSDIDTQFSATDWNFRIQFDLLIDAS